MRNKISMVAAAALIAGAIRFRQMRSIPSLISRATACLVAAGLVLTSGGLVASPARASAFTMYGNETAGDSPNPVDLQQFGVVKSTVVYDAFHFTCDASACYSNGGALPDQTTYQHKVNADVALFGGGATTPIVLDFENIVVTRWSEGAVEANNAFNLWRTLISWTKGAQPSAPVGMYGYDWNTNNNLLTAQLHENGLFDFFAPRAYTDWGMSPSAWTSRLNAAVNNDHSLAPGQPIYPYITPYYIGNGNPYLPSSVMSSEISQLMSTTEGAVMWKPSANGSAACGWISDFAYRMGQITGTSSTGTLAATWQLPNQCTVSRGATTTVPVTITNTDTRPSQPTHLSFSAPMGVTGSYSSSTVPALMPSASWSTTLYITVPSSDTDADTLCHILPGSGDRRMTVVVV